MTRRIPVIPTIVVAAAIVTMIALGFWQLDRKGQKEAMLARYERAQATSSLANYPAPGESIEPVLYRMTRIACAYVGNATTVAGRSLEGASGVAHRAECVLADGQEVTVDLGFSRDPAPVDWSGGEVQGIIAPGGRVVASVPLAGLSPLAAPDPADVPNNHLAYAGQWFFFALTALVIYILALRRRSQSGGREA